MSDIFDFLAPESSVELPSGEGFSTGFIGPVMAAVRWSFWSADDLELFKDDLPQGTVFKKRGRDGSWFYYFESREPALAATELLGAYAPRQTWRFEIPTADVINFGIANAEDLWGTSVGSDARITTLRSKYRAEFHMIALPAAVQAMALRAGFLEKDAPRPFHLDDLMGGNLIVDDDFQVSMIGNSADNYQQSELWQRRAALWAALGEDDPLKHEPKSSESKYATESDQLDACLRIVVNAWTKPVWGRLALVPDPRVDAVYGDEAKRLSIPALIEIYANEQEARAAAEQEGASAPTAKTGEEKDSGPGLPAAWQAYEKEWRAELKGRKTEGSKGKLPAAPVLKRMAGELDCTVDDIKAWWDLI